MSDPELPPATAPEPPPPPRSTCPWHPDREVVEACGRCGTLICGACAGSGPVGEPACPTCAPHHRFRTLRRAGGQVDPAWCFEVAWTLFRRNPWVIVVATLVLMVLQVVASTPAGLVQVARQELVESEGMRTLLLAAWLPLELIAYYVNFSLHVGMIIVWLRLLRGQPADPMQVFHGFRYGHLALLAAIPYMLAVVAGLLALVVGAIVVAVGLSLFLPLIVDRGLRPMASLRTSWQLTRGSRWSLFLVGLLGLPVALLGLLACCVGLVPAYGIILGAQTVAYAALTWPGNHYLDGESPVANADSALLP